MNIGLVDTLLQIKEPRILVIGDIIIDRYVFGDIKRISPEAPVPILKVDRREERLGGAAGVAAILSSLGAKVTLAGVVGYGITYDMFLATLNNHKIDFCTTYDRTRPLTIKERFIYKSDKHIHQHLLRVDEESIHSINDEVAEDLIRKIREQIEKHDLVIISDYNKGVCKPLLSAHKLINCCKAFNKPVIVDPALDVDLHDRYSSADIIKFNRKEAQHYSGLNITDVSSAFKAAAFLQKILDLKACIVTIDSEGMVLVNNHQIPNSLLLYENEYFLAQTSTDCVCDVTSAGDTVIAVLGLVLADDLNSYLQAAELANIAASIQVERLGSSPVTRIDILKKILNIKSKEKIKSFSEIGIISEAYRYVNNKIVFTNGVFDLIHSGHIDFLRKAKSLGDILIVGVNSDNSVKSLNKGLERPVQSQEDRIKILDSMEFIDYICCFDNTPLELIKSVKPDILVKGDDYKDKTIIGKNFVESYGGIIHLVPRTPNKSTTEIINKLRI